MSHRREAEPRPASLEPLPSTTVVICAYSLERWPDLDAAIDSIGQQDGGAAEVVVVIDHNPTLLARAADAWPDLRVVPSDGPPGLSGARNTGVELASTDVVAFLDDDARAEPGWLAALVEPYRQDHRVVATGGFAEPSWDAGRPRWFPDEFNWVVGCSYRGQPATLAAVRNPLGCAMSFRRDVVLAAGGFRSGIGRLGRLPIGGEETELCIRIRERHPEALILLVPEARVRHRVPAARGTWRYFASRCYQEGRSKARIASLVGAGPALESERRYTLRALPAGVARGLLNALRGRPAGLARAAAIVGGLALTTIGYLAGRLGLDALPAAVSTGSPSPSGSGATSDPE